jgi:Bacterial Ig-like domain (group 2)
MIKGALFRSETKHLASSLLLLLTCGVLTSCGGGGNGGGPSPPPSPTLTSIAVAPASPSIAKGATQQFSATGTYSDGSTQNISATAAWDSSSTAVATVASSGLASSLGIGTTTIRATLNGISGSTVLTVTAPVLTSIAVTPGSVTLGYQGATHQFVATGTYSDQSTANITGSVVWESSTPSVATVAPDGFARAAAIAGTTTITARSGTISQSASLSVQTATVSGTVTIPDSDMGWKPTIGGLQAQGGGAKVRVLGTSLSADVVATSGTTGTFSLSGVPMGTVTLVFDEGTYYDIFSAASKRVTVDVTSATVSGVAFSLVYHWRELAGYPPPWGTNNTQGPVQWKAQFLSEDVVFIAFRLDIPSDRVEIWRTLNRGGSWSRVGQWIFDQTLWNTGTWAYPSHWQNFYFLDQNRGVIHATAFGIPCDSGGGYFQTGDGGQTWTVRALPMTPTGYHVQTNAYARIGTSHIIMAGTVGCGVQGYVSGFYDAIWESVDAGVTWGLKWHSARDSSVAFIGADANSSGRAVAFRGASIQQFLLRDSQGNWSPQAGSGIGSDSRDISMVGDSAWMMSTSGTVPNGTYRSRDAGTTWSKVSDGLVQDFDFVTPLKGFSQAGGPAFSTYDGGATWRYQSPGGAIWPGVMDIWGFDRTHAAWAEVGFGDPNQRGQLFTYVEPVLANVEVFALAAPADATVGRGAAGNLMGAYELRNHGPVPVRVLSVTLHASGTGNDVTDITAIKLWRDDNGDGAVDAGDALLANATIAADNGPAVFNTATLGALEQTQVVRLLVTYDMSAATTYSGSFRHALSAGDIVAQDAEGGASVAIGPPAGMALTSRTITVGP